MHFGMDQRTLPRLREPRMDQPHGAILINKVFGMHERHIEKQACRLCNGAIPIAVNGKLGCCPRGLISGK